MTKKQRLTSHRQTGAISIMTAITFPLLIGVLVLAIDVSYALAERNNMQGAADNAARAAAQIKGLKGSSRSMVVSEALAVAAANGFYDKTAYPTRGNATIVVNAPPTSGNYQAIDNAVEVLISKPAPSFFGTAISLVAGEIGTRAVGLWEFAPCLVALNPSPSGTTGISVSGGTNLNAPCGVYSNSSSGAASVTTGGSVSNNTQLRANQLYMVGDTTDPYVFALAKHPNENPFSNPFDDVIQALPTTLSGVRQLEGASFPNLSVTNQCKDNVTVTGSTLPTSGGFHKASSTLYLAPGYYESGIQVASGMCGTGNNAPTPTSVVLLPGTFYLDDPKSSPVLKSGSTGGFSQSGLSLTGNGVAMVLMNQSDFSMGAGEITLSPYSDGGRYANITVIGNSNSNGYAGFTSATITKVDITGNFILPRKDFKVSGNVTFGNKCLTLVAWALQINSGGSLGGGCPSTRMTLSKIRGSPLVE